MQRVVKKYASHAEADAADLEAMRKLTGEERIAVLLELIMPENPNEAVMQKVVSVYPLRKYRTETMS